MIDAQSVSQQLQRILSSTQFDASERNRRFLTFVVEHAVQGHSDLVKAYTIATEVFGRGQDFDPQLDSIVRIEAGRLRRSLERYYLTEGAADPIVISIPKGSYVPSFCESQPAAETQAVPPSGKSRLEGTHTILVEPFDPGEVGGQARNYARCLARQVIVGLTRFTNLMVLEHHRQEIGPSAPQSEFVLRGNIEAYGNLLRTEVFLLSSQSSQYVWAQRYDRPLDADLLTLCDEVASRIVRAVAQPHGALFRSRTEISVPDSITRYHQYNRTLNKTGFMEALAGLSKTVARQPTNAEALSCLARLYIDAYRFRFELPGESIDPLEKARLLAQDAVELSPDSSRCYHALGMAYWFFGNVDSSLSSYHAGLEHNPNDTELMVDLGFRYALLAQWDKALPLLETGFDADPFQPGTYRVALALYYLAHGRYAESLLEARRVVAPDVIYAHLIRAVGAAQLGYQDEAKAGLDAILAVDPDYARNMVSDLKARNVHPSLIGLLAAGLAKAGMDVDLSGLDLTDPAAKSFETKAPILRALRFTGR
ncbi:MAG: hypothetical protein MUE79_03370 [Nitratireductor sp.]|nr:hypothetical protein [Nitratireductor sp.]